MVKILLVEDEAVLRETIAYNLKKESYDVHPASDGESALELARSISPDLIVLDVMLPMMDGFEVCRTIRRSSSVPILILTARDDEVDRVVGLEIGADDYLTKPFSMRELMARVKALLRRREILESELSEAAANHGEVIHAGDLEIDLGAYRIKHQGQELALKPKERDLLIYLVRHRGQVCTNSQILEAVWGFDFYGDSRTVAVHVHGLRDKLRTARDQQPLIETIRGVGYRFSG